MFTPKGILSSPYPITELTPTEKWAYKTPVRGDHIRVNRGMYNHHGIYITDDEVIHFLRKMTTTFWVATIRFYEQISLDFCVMAG